MQIGDRDIATSEQPYVIAELGVNHDGQVARALELVDAAAEAGADAVKLQYFEAERLLSRTARLAQYQRDAGSVDPFEMLRALELSHDEMARVAHHAHAQGLHAIVTVFSIELIAHAAFIEWDAYKTASPDIVNQPLIEAITQLDHPLILSTGASTSDEIVRAAGWVGAVPHAFLQCVSAYPTPFESASLGGIMALRDLGIETVGYSDHTCEIETGALAREFGACLLEKHLTYDRAAVGPDHAASLDPAAFREYVARANAAVVRADIVAVEKCVLPIEEDVRLVARQSLTSTHKLRAGHTLDRDDLTIKRPGTGIEPWRLSEVIGRQTSRDVGADMPLTDGDLRETRSHKGHD